ncbi:unnamed protein product [Parajaminaea phylloscopi]
MSKEGQNEDQEGAFVSTRSKRKKRRDVKGAVTHNKVQAPSCDDAASADVNAQESIIPQRGIRAIEERRRSLDNDSKLAALLRAVLAGPATSLKEDAASSFGFRPTSVIALGIGKVTESRSAQIQFALLLAMLDMIKGDALHPGAATAGVSICAFDPVCDKEDFQVMEHFGVSAATREDVTPRQYREPTLLYMPHCPRPLYEMYLRANWSGQEHLTHNVLLCSNRLATYAENLPSAKLARESPCVWRTLPFLSYRPLPLEPGPVAEAFNDIGFHRFSFAPTRGDDGAQEPASVTVPDEMQSLTDGLAMMTVVRSKKSRKQRRGVGQSSGARNSGDEACRPDPSTPDFWSLPEEVVSEADKEVL